MQKSVLSWSGIAILGGILLLVNSIADTVMRRFSIDLTEEGLYTLSPGTKNILKTLQEPVTLRYYFSGTDAAKFPGIKLYAARVSDLLQEYDRVGGEKVNLEVYDPRPDSEEEEWAQKYGLTPMQLPTGERLFFGLAVISGLGSEEAIPVFNLARQEHIEYDISKVIYAVSANKKPVVGILSPLKIQGETQAMQPGMPQRSEPWIVASQLGKIAEVRYLSTDVGEIAPDVNVLMVIHPKNLPEQTRYAIDQYAMRGGNLFIAVDPYCSLDVEGADPNNPMAAMTADRSSDLSEMLSVWGVKVLPKKLVGDINLATQVASQRGGMPEEFVAWLSLGNNSDADKAIINRQEVITSDLNNLMLPWAGALEIMPVDGIESSALLKTSPQAMVYEESAYRFSVENPTQLRKNYRPGSNALVLAAKVHGKLKSSFPNKPGAGEEGANMSQEGGHLAQGTEKATVIVVSDADFLADPYSAQSQNFMGARLVSLLNDNLVFVLNAIENLSGSSDLISLRSRGRFSRPFTKVQELESRAQSKWQFEEEQLEQKLNEANQRLSELQGGMKGKEGSAAVTQQVLEEVKRFRAERKEAQQRLREVRRSLRQDVEALGTKLFLANTFLVPLLLLIGTVYYSWWSQKSRKEQQLIGGEEINK